MTTDSIELLGALQALASAVVTRRARGMDHAPAGRAEQDALAAARKAIAKAESASSAKIENPLAFPHSWEDRQLSGNIVPMVEPGMALRDYWAGPVVAGVLANDNLVEIIMNTVHDMGTSVPEGFVNFASGILDAMLVERMSRQS